MCVTPPYEMGRLIVAFYTDVVTYLLEGHNYILCRNIARPGNGFNRFIHLCEKCKKVEIFLSREFFMVL